MQLLLIFGAILVPIALFLLRHTKIAVLIDFLGAVSVLLASISAGRSVLEIKLSNTVFTTHVHQIFLDPLFLCASGYISVYAVYRLLITTAYTWQKS